MVDVSGLTQEQFEDLGGGLSLAIRTLTGMQKDAEDILLQQRAASYDDYLRKFEKVQTIRAVVQDLNHIRKQAKG